MADNTIKIIEKKDPPRIKEEYSVLRITVRPSDPNANWKIAPAARKPAELKIPKPLVEKIEGPFNESNELVEELEIGETYIYKATKFKESTFTPIKHIWFAEQLDDGEIIDLEYCKGENPYLDDNDVICFKYIAKKCQKVRIYAYVAKPDKKVSIISNVKYCNSRMYFVAGAGNDLVGWNYSERFKNIWTELGISGFRKINVPSGSDYMAKYVLPLNDMLYVTQNKDEVANRASNENLASSELQKPAHRRARTEIEKDLKNNPCSQNEQLNLCGYSYGSAVVAQATIQICDDGFTVDNLILIGSPISIESELYLTLLKYQSEGKICQIVRKDIQGDYFSNTKSSIDYIKGIDQNSSAEGPHFDLARPDNPETPDINEEEIANNEIKKLGELLISKGIK